MSKTTEKQESGRIGNIIKYYRNGTQCERTMPLSVFNPKTRKQQLVRSKFGNTSTFASNVLHSVIHPYWNPIADKLNKTGYNLFMSYNSYAFRGGILTADRLRLCLSNGLIQEDYSVEKKEDRIHIRWKYSLTDHPNNDKDQLCLIVLTNDLRCKIIETKVIREDNYCEFEFLDSDEQYLFAFWRNGGKWSASKLVFCEPMN